VLLGSSLEPLGFVSRLLESDILCFSLGGPDGALRIRHRHATNSGKHCVSQRPPSVVCPVSRQVPRGQGEDLTDLNAVCSETEA
jgi:hypothetical protein